MKETKESLYREYLLYCNEENIITGHDPIDVGRMTKEWLCINAKKHSVQEIRELRDGAKRALDRIRSKKELKDKIEAYKRTDEGREFYRIHEERREQLVDVIERELSRLCQDCADMIRIVTGVVWTVQAYMSRRAAELQIQETVDGRDVQGNDFALLLDLSRPGADRLECRIGASYTFDAEQDTPGTRARFFKGIGDLMSAKKTMKTIHDRLRDAIEMFDRYRDEVQYETDRLKNPFQE